LVLTGVEQKSRGTLRKQGMMVVDAFERHLTPAIKAAIAGNSMNTNLVVIPRGMTS
jgi:hypothetical protein